MTPGLSLEWGFVFLSVAWFLGSLAALYLLFKVPEVGQLSISGKKMACKKHKGKKGGGGRRK